MRLIPKIVLFTYIFFIGVTICCANDCIIPHSTTYASTFLSGASISLSNMSVSYQSYGNDQLDEMHRQLDEVNARNKKLHKKRTIKVLIALVLAIALNPLRDFVVERIKDRDRKKFPKIGFWRTVVIVLAFIVCSGVIFGLSMLAFSKNKESWILLLTVIFAIYVIVKGQKNN